MNILYYLFKLKEYNMVINKNVERQFFNYIYFIFYCSCENKQNNCFELEKL